MPVFELEGGPYGGLQSVAGEEIRSVLYFPDRIHVKGKRGSAVYAIATRETDDGTESFGSYVEAG